MTRPGLLAIAAGSGLNPSSPTYQHASKLCATRTGVYVASGTPPPGAVETDGGGWLAG